MTTTSLNQQQRVYANNIASYLRSVLEILGVEGNLPGDLIAASFCFALQLECQDRDALQRRINETSEAEAHRWGREFAGAFAAVDKLMNAATHTPH